MVIGKKQYNYSRHHLARGLTPTSLLAKFFINRRQQFFYVSEMSQHEKQGYSSYDSDSQSHCNFIHGHLLGFASLKT